MIEDRTGQVWNYEGDILLVVGPIRNCRHPSAWLHVESEDLVEQWTVTEVLETPIAVWEERTGLTRII